MDLGLVKYTHSHNVMIGDKLYCSVTSFGVLFLGWPNIFSVRWYILAILHEKESSDPEIMWLKDEINVNS